MDYKEKIKDQLVKIFQFLLENTLPVFVFDDKEDVVLIPYFKGREYKLSNFENGQWNQASTKNIFQKIYNELEINNNVKIFITIHKSNYNEELEVELFKAGIFDVLLIDTQSSCIDVVYERILKAFK